MSTMKLVSTLLLPLLPAIFLLSSTATSAAVKPVPILDTKGAPLLQGVQYYVVPADGTPGGLGLSSKSNTCPFDVVEDFTKAGQGGGIPVTFSPVNPTDATVPTSTDLNVNMSTATVPCPTVWKLGGYDGQTGKWYVTTGETVGEPGKATISSWFKIERIAGENSYKFVFCPHVCRFCKVVCGDIGIVGGDVQRRVLGLSNFPLPLVFKKKTP